MRLTKKWIAEYIHHSNAIEGITFNQEEVLKIIDHIDKADSLKRPVLITSPTIVNHYRAIQYVKENKGVVPSLGMLCTLHRILMQDLMREGAGALRWGSVQIGSHLAPKYSEVPYLLDDWLRTWNKVLPAQYDEEPFMRHCEFEHIHPFFDGNGRTGRLLLLWDCLHHKRDMDIIKVDTRAQYFGRLQDYRKERPNILEKWA